MRRGTDSNEQQLVAYVSGANAPDAETLKVWAARYVPAYMVPAHICRVGSFQLTANGKVNRNALPEIAMGDNPAVAPSTPTEHTLAEIWREVLGTDTVDVTCSFFASGGDSFLATRLIASINRALGLDLQLRALFEHATIAALASHVDAVCDAASETMEVGAL
jgi:acyl carrier protein